MATAEAADHIDIRSDVSGMTPEEYEADVNRRFDLGEHPKVQEANQRRDDLKASTKQAFADAERLREEAAEMEEKASAAAAGQAEGDAEALFEEAAELGQKADRKEKEARAKANALKQFIGAHNTRMFIGKEVPGVDNADRFVDQLDPVAQPRRDEIQQQAEQETQAAAEQELENLLPELRERWDAFAELYEKARALSTRSYGAYSSGIGSLSSGDVEEARQRLQQAIAE